jgi:hypothetical protein
MRLWNFIKNFFTKKENNGDYEKVRTRTSKGRFVADDPNTPENEAYTLKKKKKKKSKNGRSK